MNETTIRKALSVRQPWAHAIICGGKFIENRSWPTIIRGTVAIHASQTLDKNTIDDFFQFIEQRNLRGLMDLTREDVSSLPRGAIVGLVDVVDCVTISSSPWFEGPFGFVLDRVRPLRPIPCKGALQFFEIPSQVVEAIEQQTESEIVRAQAL